MTKEQDQKLDPSLVVPGKKPVKMARLRNGDQSPIEKDLEGMNARLRDTFENRFQRLSTGHPVSDERYKRLQNGDGICEIKVKKPAAWRIFCFEHGGAIHMTHAARKPQKASGYNKHISKAQWVREEHMEWEASHGDSKPE